MKVYFTASIYFKDKRGDHFRRIVDQLVQLGAKVQSDHILKISMDDISKTTEQTSVEYYQRVKKWIHGCDLVVAEMSFLSTMNVGHEVTMALEQNKQVLGLYEKGFESLFLRGLESDNFIYLEYQDSSLELIVDEGFHYANKKQLKRFNLMLEPELINFLNEKSKNDKILKSVYIRSLIKKDKESGVL